MKNAATARDLMDTLWPEVFQTEESARSHPTREAKRLGMVPPGAAMLAVSAHAAQSLSALRRLAAARGNRRASGLTALGQFLSLARTFGTDLLVSSEKSYRATILGIHHGIGVIALLEDAAVASGDQELADFCAALVAERRRLVLVAEEALAWFAEHPDFARSRASMRAFGPREHSRPASGS